MLGDIQEKAKSSWDYSPTSTLANSVGSYMYFPGITETALKEIWFIHTYAKVTPTSGFHGKEVLQNPLPWRILSYPSLLPPLFLSDSLCLRNIFVSFCFSAPSHCS